MITEMKQHFVAAVAAVSRRLRREGAARPLAAFKSRSRRCFKETEAESGSLRTKSGRLGPQSPLFQGD